LKNLVLVSGNNNPFRDLMLALRMRRCWNVYETVIKR
jgi:hypothetical protein